MLHFTYQVLFYYSLYCNWIKAILFTLFAIGIICLKLGKFLRRKDFNRDVSHVEIVSYLYFESPDVDLCSPNNPADPAKIRSKLSDYVNTVLGSDYLRAFELNEYITTLSNSELFEIFPEDCSYTSKNTLEYVINVFSKRLTIKKKKMFEDILKNSNFNLKRTKEFCLNLVCSNYKNCSIYTAYDSDVNKGLVEYLQNNSTLKKCSNDVSLLEAICVEVNIGELSSYLILTNFSQDFFVNVIMLKCLSNNPSLPLFPETFVLRRLCVIKRKALFLECLSDSDYFTLFQMFTKKNTRSKFTNVFENTCDNIRNSKLSVNNSFWQNYVDYMCSCCKLNNESFFDIDYRLFIKTYNLDPLMNSEEMSRIMENPPTPCNPHSDPQKSAFAIKKANISLEMMPSKISNLLCDIETPNSIWMEIGQNFSCSLSTIMTSFQFEFVDKSTVGERDRDVVISTKISNFFAKLEPDKGRKIPELLDDSSEYNDSIKDISSKSYTFKPDQKGKNKKASKSFEAKQSFDRSQEPHTPEDIYDSMKTSVDLSDYQTQSTAEKLPLKSPSKLQEQLGVECHDEESLSEAKLLQVNSQPMKKLQIVQGEPTQDSKIDKKRKRSSQIDGERSPQIDEKRSSKQTEKRPSQLEDKRRSQVDSKRPSQIDESVVSPIGEKRPSQMAEKRPSQLEDKRKSQIDSKRQSQDDAAARTSVSEKRPSQLEEKRRSQVDSKRPSQMDEGGLSPRGEKRPSQMAEKRPSQLEDKRRSQADSKRPSQMDESGLSPRGEKRPSQMAEKRPSQLEDKRRSQVDSKRPSQMDEGGLSPRGEKRPSQMADKRPSQLEDKRKSQVDSKRQSQVDDAARTSISEKRPSQLAEKRPSQLEDKRRSQVDSKRPSQMDEGGLSPRGEKRPSQMADKRPSQLEDKRRSQVDSKRPSQMDEGGLSPRGEKRTSQMADKRPSQLEDKRKSQVDSKRQSQVDDAARTSVSAKRPSQLAEKRPSQMDEGGLSPRGEKRPSQMADKRPSQLVDKRRSQVDSKRPSQMDEGGLSPMGEKRPSQLTDKRKSQTGGKRISQIKHEQLSSQVLRNEQSVTPSCVVYDLVDQAASDQFTLQVQTLIDDLSFSNVLQYTPEKSKASVQMADRNEFARNEENPNYLVHYSLEKPMPSNLTKAKRKKSSLARNMAKTSPAINNFSLTQYGANFSELMKCKRDSKQIRCLCSTKRTSCNEQELCKLKDDDTVMVCSCTHATTEMKVDVPNKDYALNISFPSSDSISTAMKRPSNFNKNEARVDFITTNSALPREVSYQTAVDFSSEKARIKNVLPSKKNHADVFQIVIDKHTKRSSSKNYISTKDYLPGRSVDFYQLRRQSKKGSVPSKKDKVAEIKEKKSLLDIEMKAEKRHRSRSVGNLLRIHPDEKYLGRVSFPLMRCFKTQGCADHCCACKNYVLRTHPGKCKCDGCKPISRPQYNALLEEASNRALVGHLNNIVPKSKTGKNPQRSASLPVSLRQKAPPKSKHELLFIYERHSYHPNADKVSEQNLKDAEINAS